MRKLVSAVALAASVILSVATSTLPTETASSVATGPRLPVGAEVGRYTVSVHAAQSPAGAFDGTLDIDATLTGSAGAVVEATLSTLGGEVLTSDHLVLTGAEEGMLLSTKLDCRSGSVCDQQFVVTFAAPNGVDVDWEATASLVDPNNEGLVGAVDVFVH